MWNKEKNRKWKKRIKNVWRRKGMTTKKEILNERKRKVIVNEWTEGIKSKCEEIERGNSMKSEGWRRNGSRKWKEPRWKETAGSVCNRLFPLWHSSCTCTPCYRLDFNSSSDGMVSHSLHDLASHKGRSDPRPCRITVFRSSVQANIRGFLLPFLPVRTLYQRYVCITNIISLFSHRVNNTSVHKLGSNLVPEAHYVVISGKYISHGAVLR